MRTAVNAVTVAVCLLVGAAPDGRRMPPLQDAAPGPAAVAASKACRQSNALFLRHGINEISARGISCRRAVRVVTVWARAETPGIGPKGWRCSSRERRGFDRVTCRRAEARMRFDVGGG